MNVYIIYLGEPKEKYLNDALAEYEKRISSFARVINVGLKPITLPDDPSDAEISAALEKEADAVLRELGRIKQCKKIALCIEGKQYSSEELSKIVSSSAIDGFSSIAFVIGSSFGLSPRVKKECDLLLSFSRMTFPHQLMRVILAEQIYRAFMIERGSKYHK